MVGPLELAAIRGELDRTSVLFGPDTFTGHLAAMSHIPQVTLQLPEHRAWINPATPTFIVPVAPNCSGTAAMAAAHLVFVLRAAEGDLVPRWGAWAAEWRAQMAVVRRFVETATRTQPSEPTMAVANALDSLEELSHTLPEVVFERPSGLPSKPDLARYASPGDAWRALTRWYVGAATSGLSAAAYVVTSFER
jgi:hypothetical protein